MTVPNAGQPTSTGNRSEAVKNTLGLLLAGFVGALNVFGLSSGEVSTILRNDGLRAAYIGFLLFAGLLAAVVAVIMPEDKKVSALRSLSLIVVCSVPISFTIWAVRIPGPGSDLKANVFLGVSCTLGLVALILFIFAAVKDSKPPTPQSKTYTWDGVLLICAVILVPTAIYAAAREETKSQLDATYPQVAATMKVDGGTGEVSASVSASKMSEGNKVGVLIRGIPRGMALGGKCDNEAVGECFQRVCRDYPKGPCRHILSGAFEPNSTGGVEAQVVSAPFSLSAYQLVEVRATNCGSPQEEPTKPAPTSKPTKPAPRSSECRYDKVSLFYLSVPPSEPRQPSGSPSDPPPGGATPPFE